MYRPSLFGKIFFALILIFLTSAELYAAQEVPGERLVERKVPTLVVAEEKKGQLQVSCFYERSNIVQGSRYGHWEEIVSQIGYSQNNIQGYFSTSDLRRFNETDHTYNLGAYFNFKNYYIHEEFGLGSDVDFIYKRQNILEIGHRLKKTLFWQVGYNYRGYKVNDNHIFYPGLIYYFGDNYISADYGLSYIQNRGNAQFGTIKTDFAVTKFLHWSLGAAVGERLYDIFELPASKEYGYIFFTGANLIINKNISFKAGYSYGHENPKFLKRSFNFNLSFKL